MSTRDEILSRGAEELLGHARGVGQRAGFFDGTEAVQALEMALTLAWAEVAHFRGANDTHERLEETIRTMNKRMADCLRRQHFLMRGHKGISN